LCPDIVFWRMTGRHRRYGAAAASLGGQLPTPASSFLGRRATMSRGWSWRPEQERAMSQTAYTPPRPKPASATEQVKQTAEDTFEGGKAKAREAKEAFTEVADSFGDALDDSIKNRPYATLAIAAGIGFLFGACWSR
jgi:ElaB/YqjD/DUF883 family membrane-anchored ribosome-binding protein